MTHLYGRAIILSQAIHYHRPLGEKLTTLGLPLLGTLGGVGAALLLLCLAGLQARAWVVAVAGVASLLALASIPLLGSSDNSRRAVLLLGAILLAALGAVAWRQLRERSSATLFLALWLLVELTAYFLISPHPAVRRVMGIVLAGTLLAARLASLKLAPRRARVLWGIAAFSATLGAAYWAVDYREAWAQRRGVELVASMVRRDHPGATIWFAGHWGLQYYGERAGMKPLISGVSKPAAGDYLALPGPRIFQQSSALGPGVSLRKAFDALVEDPLPAGTVVEFYFAIHDGIPFGFRDDARLKLTVFEVRR